MCICNQFSHGILCFHFWRAVPDLSFGVLTRMIKSKIPHRQSATVTLRETERERERRRQLLHRQRQHHGCRCRVKMRMESSSLFIVHFPPHSNNTYNDMMSTHSSSNY